MPSSFPVSAMRRPRALSPVRFAIATAGLLALSLSSPSASAGQSPVPQPGRLELRVPAGAFLPTGDQRDAVGDAHVTAVQLSHIVRPQLALTGTFAWARSRDLASIDAPKLDVFTSDVGLEARTVEHFTDGPVAISLFAGLGGGVRSYNHRSLNVDAAHHVTGYGSVGAELGMGRVGLRAEVRNYLSSFEPLIGPGTSEVRNDVVMTVALRFNRHRTSTVPN